MVAKTYDRQTAKLIATVCQNLPEMSADVMQGWIENPKSLQRVLKVLCPPETARFKTFRTIQLGTGLTTAGEFQEALYLNGFNISGWGYDILYKAPLTAMTGETEVDLVVVSVAELGFKKEACLSDIYKRALEIGLELCPAEVGPQLRLQYKDQPRGESLNVGMKPICDSVFIVEHSNMLYLGGNNGYFRSTYGEVNRWVFLRHI